jgi:NADPH-dependent F420 reductase
MAIIAIIGGTGAEGRGLGLRFAMAGHPVILGSRDPDRAAAAARELLEIQPGLPITSASNADAARGGEWVVLSLPYEGLASTVESLAPSLTGKLVISVVAPLAFVDRRPQAVEVPEGSAAQQVGILLPHSRVVAAFHQVSAPELIKPNEELLGDVVVCGDDDEAKNLVMALVEQIRSLRALDGGGLELSRYVEQLTVLLLSINRRYKARSSIRFEGL